MIHDHDDSYSSSELLSSGFRGRRGHHDDHHGAAGGPLLVDNHDPSSFSPVPLVLDMRGQRGIIQDENEDHSPSDERSSAPASLPVVLGNNDHHPPPFRCQHDDARRQPFPPIIGVRGDRYSSLLLECIVIIEHALMIADSGLQLIIDDEEQDDYDTNCFSSSLVSDDELEDDDPDCCVE